MNNTTKILIFYGGSGGCGLAYELLGMPESAGVYSIQNNEYVTALTHTGIDHIYNNDTHISMERGSPIITMHRYEYIRDKEALAQYQTCSIDISTSYGYTYATALKLLKNALQYNTPIPSEIHSVTNKQLNFKIGDTGEVDLVINFEKLYFQQDEEEMRKLIDFFDSTITVNSLKHTLAEYTEKNMELLNSYNLLGETYER